MRAGDIVMNGVMTANVPGAGGMHAPLRRILIFHIKTLHSMRFNLTCSRATEQICAGAGI